MQESINFDLPVVLQAANVYGPGQDLYRIIPGQYFHVIQKHNEVRWGGLSKIFYLYR